MAIPPCTKGDEEMCDGSEAGGLAEDVGRLCWGGVEDVLYVLCEDAFALFTSSLSLLNLATSPVCT